MFTDSTAATDETGNESDSASEDESPVILTVEDIPLLSNQVPLTQSCDVVHEPVVKRQQQRQDNVTVDTTAASSKPNIAPSIAIQQHRAHFPQGII